MVDYSGEFHIASRLDTVGLMSQYQISEIIDIWFATALVSRPSLISQPTNYKLAFSTETPTQRPSVGQLWPRGAGNRI